MNLLQLAGGSSNLARDNLSGSGR